MGCMSHWMYVTGTSNGCMSVWHIRPCDIHPRDTPYFDVHRNTACISMYIQIQRVTWTLICHDNQNILSVCYSTLRQRMQCVNVTHIMSECWYIIICIMMHSSKQCMSREYIRRGWNEWMSFREVGGWGRVPFSRNLMSPTPRRKWYLTTGLRFQ